MGRNTYSVAADHQSAKSTSPKRISDLPVAVEQEVNARPALPDIGNQVCEKMPQVSEQFLALEKLVSVLHEHISILGKKLDPILSPELCKPEGVGAEKSAPQAPLASGLRAINLRLAGAISRVEDLGRRVEV